MRLKRRERAPNVNISSQLKDNFNIDTPQKVVTLVLLNLELRMKKKKKA